VSTGITHKLKRTLYRACQFARKNYWRSRGGRTVRLFGTSVTVHPDTDFPSYRRFKLPQDGTTERIVQYADFVQLMSIARHLSELAEPPSIVEIGAYEGAYAVILGKLAASKKGHLLAVEPNSQSFKTLTWNVTKNELVDTVTCVQAAVGEHRRVARLSLDRSQSAISGDAPWQIGCATEEIRVEPLSTLLADRGITKVHLLIVDVEGAELPVLRSLEWNTVTIERIYCELHPYAWPSFGYTKEEMFSFLKSRELRALDMFFRELGPQIPDDYIGPALLCK
jgi:FkbM family methyltransferase